MTMIVATEPMKENSATPSTRPARPWSSPVKILSVFVISIDAMEKTTVVIIRTRLTARRRTLHVLRGNLPALMDSASTTVWCVIRFQIAQMIPMSQPTAMSMSAPRLRSISVVTSAWTHSQATTVTVTKATSKFIGLIC